MKYMYVIERPIIKETYITHAVREYEDKLFAVPVPDNVERLYKHPRSHIDFWVRRHEDIVTACWYQPDFVETILVSKDLQTWYDFDSAKKTDILDDIIKIAALYEPKFKYDFFVVGTNRNIKEENPVVMDVHCCGKYVYCLPNPNSDRKEIIVVPVPEDAEEHMSSVHVYMDEKQIVAEWKSKRLYSRIMRYFNRSFSGVYADEYMWQDAVKKYKKEAIDMINNARNDPDCDLEILYLDDIVLPTIA